MTGLLQDVLYSVRQIRRAPGFAVAAIITIALGISANSTIFSWIQSTLLTPIPAVTHTNNFFSVERGVPNDNPDPAVFLPGPQRCTARKSHSRRNARLPR